MFSPYNKEAYNLLKKCSYERDITEWNKYREQAGNKKINFRFADLRNLYLQNANLKNIDFRFASLDNADMLVSDVENAKIATYIHYIFVALCFATIYVVIYFITLAITQDQKVATATAAGAVGVVGVVVGATVVVAVVVAVAAAGALVGVGATVVGATVVVAVGATVAVAVVYAERIDNLKAIGRAKNPELAIGFDQKYKQTDISVEIEKLEQTAKEIMDEDKRNELLQKIEALKQQTTIKEAIKSLKEPYKYLEHEIKKLRIHNYFFYTLIITSLVVAIYYGIGEYQNRNSYMSVLFGDVKSVDFGSILGISLFYGTPIVFLMFVAVYGVSQINKNIDKIHELSTQKHYIEILESAFNSKTQAGATDEEIQKDLKTAADAIRDATIAKMLGKEPKTEEAQKEERYRDRLDYKAIMPLLTALLKSKG
jgi:hypothetical protein